MTGKILMVDDDKEMCLELSEILADCGYEVQTAFDGKSGYDLLCGESFDLVLLDMKMPVMTGLEVLQKLREDKNRVKVLVLSGRPFAHNLKTAPEEKDESARILQLANSVINKPFDVIEVLKRVEALLKEN